MLSVIHSQAVSVKQKSVMTSKFTKLKFVTNSGSETVVGTILIGQNCYLGFCFLFVYFFYHRVSCNPGWLLSPHVEEDLELLVLFLLLPKY